MSRIVLALIVAVVAMPAASAATAGAGTLVLDLTNWGEGVYYLKGKVLGHETNGKEGFQDAPTVVGNVAGDAIILP